MKSSINVKIWGLALVIFAFVCNGAFAQMKVNGRFVYSKCGEKVVFRGVEHMIYYHDQAGDNIAEVAKTGANCIRFILDGTVTGPQLDALLNKAITQSHMYVSIALWNPSLNLAWWQKQDVKDAIAKYKDYVVLHGYGEAEFTDAPRWRDEVKARIAAIRAAGYDEPIDVISNTYGRDPNAIITYGQEIFDSDPLKNIIFGCQMYWGTFYTGLYGYSIEQACAKFATLPWPVQVGACASDCDTDCGYQAWNMSYKYDLGCLWWCWRGDQFTLTADVAPYGQYNNLSAYGQYIVNNATYGLKTTSIKPTSLLNLSCGTTTTYSLNTSATNGIVTKSPNQTSYNSGSTVSLTATANSGYTFNGWSGDASGSTNPLSVTMNANKNITANFAAINTNVAVTGVSVSPTSASVAVGATTALTATVAPSNATNKNVSWSSSNTSVATVSSTGVVTGVAAGSATITVTTQDGARTATSAITVTSSTVSVTGVSVSPTSASIAVGGTTTLTATVAPANATNKNVTWNSSNTSVATVSSTGVVTGVAAGSATITVTTQDGARTATSAITVTGGSTGTTNIATSGTGTTWNDIPSASSTSDASKSTNVAINNSNTSVDVVYSDASAAGNWQAAGIVWSTAQLGITSVKFYNGTCVTLGDNGVFSAGVKIQQSTDGTTWTDIASWSISPAYQYTAASSNVVYTFSGASLSNVRGIRVIGQVRTNDSWSINVKEVEVYTGSSTTVAVTGVSVTPTSASVGVGATTSLTATVAPSNATNKNVTWSSSNTSVATVSSTGVVTGVAAGSATITVTTQDGARTATSTITVTATNVAVTGVSVSPTSSSVSVGATTSLTATVAPSNATNKNVTWSSSNTSVATVSSTGVVTGVAAGSATITVTTQDGARTATSAITVTGGSTGSSATINFTSSAAGNLANPYNDASGYTLTGATSSGVAEPLVVLSNAGNNVARNTNFQSRITITKTGGGAFNLTSLKYASDPWGGLADATVTGTLSSGGTVTASISSASTTLQTSTLNWSGVTQVVIDFNGGTSSNYGMLDDFVVSSGSGAIAAAKSSNSLASNTAKSYNDLVIYPNPAKTYASFNYFAEQSSNIHVSVLNSVGAIVKQTVQSLSKGDNLIQIDVKNLSNGIYIVKVSNGNTQVTRKLMVNK